jgi:hypothetical protein
MFSFRMPARALAMVARLSPGVGKYPMEEIAG